ncbi:UNVERIFIED_CONTAM: hypothetical protein Sangu_2203400 [Sesamum angustifolium]|uniref:Transmembrane protein 120 homolog n=1 Tax=Sesamum angustifolium TaxID=2727405 RepID=A0AAW2LJK4_9LAMI
MGESPGESPSVGGEVSRLVEQAKELQEAASSLISRTSAEEDALRQRVSSLDSHINSLRSSLRSSKNYDKKELTRARYVLSEGDAAAFLPSKSHGRFLRMFLGPINVRANRKDVQLKVKEEYNNFRRGVQLFLKWAIMQGVAMMLQNRYQRQRLYTRIALGKPGEWMCLGETAGVEGQLLLLCPILFILQGFEAYVGVLLLQTALVRVSSDWQVITCGILLIIMAVGNFANTVQTLMTKSRVKAKIKRGKSRQELNQGSEGKSL